MSLIQSRSEKNESHYRRSGDGGRSGNYGQQRTFNAGGSRGGGRGRGRGRGSATGPPLSGPPSISSNQSFKKSSNAQGARLRSGVVYVNTSDSSTATGNPRVQNGAHVQSPLHGVPPPATTAKKPAETPKSQSSQAIPRNPSSQLSTKISDSTAPTTPAKVDVAQGSTLQFGSISPGFMNGVQVPARTSSAPPNMDEQKRDQMRHDSSRAVPAIPVPSGSKLQMPEKDVTPGETRHDSSGAVPAIPVPSASKPQMPNKDVAPGEACHDSSRAVSAIPVPSGPKPQMPEKDGASGETRHDSSGAVPAIPAPFGSKLQMPNKDVAPGETRHDSSRVVHAIPVPSGSKPQMPKKNVAPVEQPSSRDTRADSQAIRNVQFTSAAPPTQSQKPSVLSVSGVSMPTPFHQLPLSVQFGGPNPQFQSECMPATSLQMPMQRPLLMGGASQVQQQVFVPGLPGLQCHLIQSQGLMHQGQSFGFNPQLCPQLPPHFGNLGVSMPPQFTQQQTENFDGTRKTVKITHPQTHEELRLDKRPDSHTDGGSSGSEAHNDGPPQPQPVPTYTATHPVGYYPNSYTGGPLFFSAPISLPLTNAQLTASPQAPRFNYSANQVPQTMPFANQSALNLFPVNQSGSSVEPSSSDQARHITKADPSTLSSTVYVTVKPAILSATERVVDSNVAGKIESSKLLQPPAGPGPAVKDLERSQENSLASPKPGFWHPKQSAAAPAPVLLANRCSEMASSVSTIGAEESASTLTDMNSVGREIVSGSDSITKKHVNKGHVQPSQQVISQDPGNSFKLRVPNSVEAKTAPASSGFEGVSSKSSETDADLNKAAEDHLSWENEHPAYGVVSDSSRDREVEEQCPRVREWDSNSLRNAPDSDSVESVSVLKKTKQDVQFKESGHEGGVHGTSHGDPVSAAYVDSDRMAVEPSSSDHGFSAISDSHDAVSRNRTSNRSSRDTGLSNIVMSEDVVAADIAKTADVNSVHEEEVIDKSMPTSSSDMSSGSRKAPSEPNKTKNTKAKGKKKRKEILQKADTTGSTSDLYMAYKGPEEKKGTVAVPGDMPDANVKQVSADTKLENVTETKEVEQNKADLDDWEDVADVSMPKLNSSGKGDHGKSVHAEGGITDKKYSRDFLLTFAEQCTDLPHGFEITSYIVDALMRGSVSFSHGGDHPSPGRTVDRSSRAGRNDRRGSGEPDRWSKLPGARPSGRDAGMDLGYGSNMTRFLPGPGSNYGVLRNPRGQEPIQHHGGILSGPSQSLRLQGVQRSNSEADRWQRGTNFNKGLMPSPQTPLQVMHKAEKKYAVGKVAADEEEAKQRRLKGILNKLTPQNFEKLFEQVKEVNIDNAVTLTGVISQIFDKALMEPTFCEMYANFCFHLAAELPELRVDNEKITFKRLLLNKCQEEFERGEREEEEAKEADGEGESKQTEEEREEKRLKARRRMLGNIRLIGELYKKRMLTERIMHECIMKLLGQYEDPDEENIEALCKLMSTIGEIIDHPKAKKHIDAYFDRMSQLSNNMKLSSRVRFMLKDAIDLRKNKWQQRRKVEGPKKIEEVHKDAAQERQGQANRLVRGPSMSSSTRRAPPLDYGPRGSTTLPSPVGQPGGPRGLPSQARGFGVQDVRVDERNVRESRTNSVNLPQRPLGDDSITLGPQGGLTRGMPIRGQPSTSSSSLANVSPAHSDSWRTIGGSNGYGSVSEHPVNHWNPERSWDRPTPALSPAQAQGTPPVRNVSSDKVWPEERLQDMAISAIKEFYSAKDEKEVALCVKDLKAPGFHPTVISLWLTDSFERKDAERDSLTKLLVNLTKPKNNVFDHSQLIKGFEFVLTELEDTVTDAPKAPEYLGRVFANVIIENIASLKEIGRLIHKGVEVPGRLLKSGLAGDILGSILERIKLEKGESTLKEILGSSNLRLEDFKPPDPLRSGKLEMFL